MSELNIHFTWLFTSTAHLIPVFTFSHPEPSPNILSSQNQNETVQGCGAYPRLFTSSLDGTIREWDTKKSICRGVVLDVGEPIISLASNSRYLYAGTKSGRLLVHDLNHHGLTWPDNDFPNTGELNNQPYRRPQEQWTNIRAVTDHYKFPPGASFTTQGGGVAHRDMVTALVANNEYVCSGCSDGSIHLWDVMTGAHEASFKHTTHRIQVRMFEMSLVVLTLLILCLSHPGS